jgi:three-Cys-motif partner protein
MRQRFGGRHTERKLDALERYLDAYTTALKNQSFELIYFDAFAGTGDIVFSRSEVTAFFGPVAELGTATRGSARRALEIGNPFHRYIFVERSSAKISELEKLRREFPTLDDRMEFRHGDANAELVSFCSDQNWRSTRAVVFLDPFGNDVAWQTIEAIALTRAIDTWYLFPAGLGVARQIGNDGSVHWTHEKSLDRLFGTTEWRKAAVRQRETEDLFGPRTETEKTATPQSMTELMIARMRTVFRGGVLSEWLPLGSNNTHMYSLIFAWANPNRAATRLAKTLARAVLK